MLAGSTYMLAVFCVLALLQKTNAIHDSLNFIVQPMKRECFYEDFEEKSLSARKIEVFLQTGGNNNIILTIHGPLSEEDIQMETFENPIFKDTINAYKEGQSDSQTYVTDFKPDRIGTYSICLDNRSTRFIPKSVQLDVSPSQLNGPVEIKLTGSDASEEEAVSLAQSLNALSKIHRGITKIQMQQQRDRHRLALHSEKNVDNYNNVMFGSIIETAIFVAVSVFQIVFVRRWFAGRATGKK